MGRFTFLLLLAIAAAVNPGLRSRLEPHLRFATDPLYEWQAERKIREVVGALEDEAASNRPLPTATELRAFLQRRYAGEDAGDDPWGTPYYLSGRKASLRVGSAGRDRKRGTTDDIVSAPFHPAR